MTNIEMDNMLRALGPLLERRDVIGYAAARNARLLRDELTEYHKVLDELVEKYGERELDEDGNETGRMRMSPASERFRDFADELRRYAEISHDFEPFRIKYTEAIGQLSGQEMLAVDWMFED